MRSGFYEKNFLNPIKNKKGDHILIKQQDKKFKNLIDEKSLKLNKKWGKKSIIR